MRGARGRGTRSGGRGGGAVIDVIGTAPFPEGRGRSEGWRGLRRLPVPLPVPVATRLRPRERAARPKLRPRPRRVEPQR
ncbi:unnamed protein product, partial [Bubo scandiacus]